jgi:hypothetical protein
LENLPILNDFFLYLGLRVTTEEGNGENCILGSFVILLLTKKYLGGSIKDSEMGRVCGTCGGEERSCSILVRKPEGKRPIGKPRRR